MSDDPFGLWQTAPTRPAGEVSYGPGEAPPEDAAVIWSLDLGQASSDLERREATIEVIQPGLDQAEERLERFFSSQGETGRQVSYDSGPSTENLLLLALSEVDPDRFPPEGAVSYGWTDLLKWDEMRQRFEQFSDLMNRLVVNFVWVETSENGRVIALTKINWANDLNAYWGAGISAQQVAVHERSLNQAVRYRAANLRTYLRVIQMALRIIRAVSTPMGAVDALALAWQFVQDVILPLIQGEQTAPASR